MMNTIFEDTQLLSTVNRNSAENSGSEPQSNSSDTAVPPKSTMTPSGIRIVTSEEEYLLRKLQASS